MLLGHPNSAQLEIIPRGYTRDAKFLYSLRSLKTSAAGVQGLEPQLTVPETVVLPLDDTPICLLANK